MIDPYAKRIKNPVGDLLKYLNLHEEDKLNNENLVFLLKNILTHFRKLFYSTSLVYNLQKNKEFLDNYNRNNVFSIQNIEYFYYKVATIWDISFEIADILVFPRNKGKKGKYDFLSEKFEEYNHELSNLDFSWYKNDIAKIRNRIVHGGINIMPFFVDDNHVKTRICFQAYDLDLNDLTRPSYFYSNIYNNNINYADNYFSFHIHLLYSYLIDFFKFVLLEMTKNKSIDLHEDLSKLDSFSQSIYKQHDTWLLSNVEDFVNITNDMVILDHCKGILPCSFNIHPNQIDIIRRSYYSNFPFSMMNNISEGDWVIDKSN